MASRKTVAAATEAHEWDKLGTDTEFVDEPVKVSTPIEIPKAIVELAQKALTGSKVNGKEVHTIDRRFDSPEKAEAFATLIKEASEHTTPPCSIRVTVDPKDEGDNLLVRFRAGKRRGRKTEKPS